MKPESSKPNDADIRDAIGELVFGNDEEIAREVLAMSEEEIAAKLTEAGIDTNTRFEAIRQRMKTAVGRMRLSAAQESLGQAQQKPSSKSNWAREMTDPETAQLNPQSRISSRLGSTGAAAFFRKNEGIEDEDVEGMAEDLDELEEDLKDEDDG
jgi:hypothetical protein